MKIYLLTNHDVLILVLMSNPLQCSCLQNPRDGGAWWAAIYRVAPSRIRLKRLSSSSSWAHTFPYIYTWYCNSLDFQSTHEKWGNKKKQPKDEKKKVKSQMLDMTSTISQYIVHRYTDNIWCILNVSFLSLQCKEQATNNKIKPLTKLISLIVKLAVGCVNLPKSRWVFKVQWTKIRNHLSQITPQRYSCLMNIYESFLDEHMQAAECI